MAKKNESCDDNGIGLFGIAAIAAGVAAGYFLYGSKEGAKNRKKVKGWMLKAKGEVLEKMEKMKDIDEEDYNKVIDVVAEKYAKMKTLDRDEVMTVMADLKKHWKQIDKKIEPKRKTAVRKAKTTAKKTATRFKKTAKATEKKLTRKKAMPKRKSAVKKAPAKKITRKTTAKKKTTTRKKKV